MSVTCPGIPGVSRGQATHIDIDWGENTAGSETGMLKNGDTVESCVIALDDSPTGSTTPTLGSVSVNVADVYINRRSCSAGEATTCLVTMLASQTYGRYRLKFTAITTNGEVIPRFVVLNCVSGGG